MRISFFLLFCLGACTAYTQTLSPTITPRASAGIQVGPGQYGGFVELFLKPKVSVWSSFDFLNENGQLQFGEDTTSGTIFNPPLETIDYNNLQKQITIRTGVRFFVPTTKEKITFWHSPIVGFRNLTAPSEDYMLAVQREDLNILSEIGGFREAERELEVGGEIGLPLMFWRKPDTNTSLYLEGSSTLLARRSLIGGRTSSESASLGFRAALGFTF